MLEEAATSLGLLPDLSERATKEKFWLRGKVRGQLEPGMLLRVSAPTMLVDPTSIMKTLTGFQEAMGDDDPRFRQMLKMVKALYGASIALSIRPTENAASRSAFVGTIPHDHGFSPMARDLLLSRIGPDPVHLTSLAQVARIPTEREDTSTPQQQLATMSERMKAMTGDGLDRGLLDQFVSQMGAVLERFGFAAAPKWPAISVIPLAIYRNVLPIELSDGHDSDDTN